MFNKYSMNVHTVLNLYNLKKKKKQSEQTFHVLNLK